MHRIGINLINLLYIHIPTLMVGSFFLRSVPGPSLVNLHLTKDGRKEKYFLILSGAVAMVTQIHIFLTCYTVLQNAGQGWMPSFL